MHVRVCMDVGREGRHAGACSSAHGCARGSVAGRAGARAGMRGRARARAGERLDARARGSLRLRVHCSTESTIFTRNEEINLK
ncbi:hypothetical protein CRG98_007613 [Punica granatum]|uniref:Uncharacterized protein n=1 Tax=Punica granatum TaxID=22663 RepID=A0A2I0KU39_PUNGR|nr:hypothetical protein CRG98_007613 [Punica granatum]